MDTITTAATDAKNAVMGQPTEADKAKSTVDDVGNKVTDGIKSAIETGDSAAKDATKNAESMKAGAESNVQSAVDATKDQIKAAADAVSGSMDKK